MSEPLVSVVVPCYNHEKYVQECIQSIIDQDYQNIELIIIDDGSKDRSVDKIKELVLACEQRFVRFEFRSRPNKGLCATLNEAIDWCNGEYYSAIASDDLMLPNKSSLQVKYLIKNSQCVAVFGGVKVINDNGKVFRIEKGKVGSYKFEDIFLKKHSLSAPTQMIRLAALKIAGPYPEDLYIEDWYMWLKLTHNRGRLDDLGDVVAAYRRHNNNISNNLEKMNASRFDIVMQYRKHKAYNNALARIYLSAALDVQRFRKLKSFRYMLRAISHSPAIFYDCKFYSLLAKFMFSKRYLEKRVSR